MASVSQKYLDMGRYIYKHDSEIRKKFFRRIEVNRK